MSELEKPEDGDEVIFKFQHGKWAMHVKYASGGISGRIMPYESFDQAVADLKKTFAAS